MKDYDIDELNPYEDRQFTEKDDKWTDCTDVDFSNRRKNEFKVYSNHFVMSLIHIFPSQERDGIKRYHVVDEHLSMERDPLYFLLTEEEIEEKYHLKEKLIMKER